MSQTRAVRTHRDMQVGTSVLDTDGLVWRSSAPLPGDADPGPQEMALAAAGPDLLPGARQRQLSAPAPAGGGNA